jgi:hypothetical protein
MALNMAAYEIYEMVNSCVSDKFLSIKADIRYN